jgi:predicted ester cyclase
VAGQDTLDFDVFSNQKWDRLKETHAPDITVTWPDGHETHGLDRHIEDLKAMFVAVPDTRIKSHPIKIANGHWTAVVGVLEGTFSKPMKTPDGNTIPPTGKKLNMQMVTVGHWTDAGVMDHEWLFWDNQTYMKQLGTTLMVLDEPFGRTMEAMFRKDLESAKSVDAAAFGRRSMLAHVQEWGANQITRLL